MTRRSSAPTSCSASLLEQVDLERDAVIVVAPYASGEGTDLTVVGVHAPAIEPGLLSSGTTRRAGFVQTVDVAPSILSLVGAEQPSSMEGTVMERADSGWRRRPTAHVPDRRRRRGEVP